MSFSIIQKAKLEGVKRLDAEFYQLEYLLIDKKLIGQPKLINIVKDVVCGPFGSSVLNSDYKQKGVPLLRVVNLNSDFINVDDLVYIDQKLSEKLNRYKVNSDDIVVSQRGTIAMFSLVTDDYPAYNISANLISILNSNKINFKYLIAYLNSKYGREQLRKRTSGQVQEKITTKDVKDIIVYVPERDIQEEISSLVDKAENKKKKAATLYQQAESLLLGELRIKDLDLNDSLCSVVNLSEVTKARRIDAEYFQDKYNDLMNILKKNKVKLLKEVLENIPAKFDPKKQLDKKFNYVELSNINTVIGIIDGSSEVLGKEAPSRAKRTLKTGDIIVSTIKGSLEKAALVYKEQENYLASTGFFQFRSKEVVPEVLLIMAKSIVLQWQLEQRTAGTILTAVPKDSIKNILIPILPKATQQKIADLVCKSHEANKKAKELLEEAKKKVEKEIEKADENKTCPSCKSGHSGKLIPQRNKMRLEQKSNYPDRYIYDECSYEELV